MSINNVDNSVIQGLGLDKPVEKNGNEINRDAFMKLMITQLRNQDPLKPMQGGEFFSQIAQFSAVSGINELQNSFSTLAGALKSNQALQASSMIGRRVVIKGDQISTGGKSEIDGIVRLKSSVDNLVINITDRAGQVVRSMNFGQQTEGDKNYIWDLALDNGAIANDGVYSIKAYGVNGGKAYELESMIADKVESVSIDQNSASITLNTEGMGSVSFSNVEQIM